MLATANEQNPPRTVDEAYQGACETSSLKLENHRHTAASMIAAAGMNKHRTGLTLLRLASEWASSAKPIAPTRAAIEALAHSYPTEGPTTRAKVKMTAEQIESAIVDGGLDRGKLKGFRWTASVEVPNPHQGKVKTVRDDTTSYHLPAKLAHAEAWNWHQHELTLLMMGLKSLPAVRDAILHRSRTEGWGCDEHHVAATLLWWLDPKCPKCGGQNEVVKLRGKDVGKVCSHCKGTGLDRQGDPPHGPFGRKIASHIRACIADARKELKEGAYRLHRTPAGKEHRGE